MISKIYPYKYILRICKDIFYILQAAGTLGNFSFMRQAPERSSREDPKSRAHSSIPAAAAGLLDRDDHTATAPVGAGALHGQKWSRENKNGHACCLDGCT